MGARGNLDSNTKILDAIIKDGGDIEVRHAGGKDIMVVLSTGRSLSYGDSYQGKGHGTSFLVALDRAVADLAKDMKGEDWEDVIDHIEPIARVMRKEGVLRVSKVGYVQ